MRTFVLYFLAVIGAIGCISNVILSFINPRYFDSMWSIYKNNSEPFIGIFTIVGTLFALFILRETTKATKNATENLRVARETLETTMETGRKDDFIKQFILLLELHGKSHDVLAKYLDDTKIVSSDPSSLIHWDMTIQEATNKLFQNHSFSPYMRMVFRALKYVDENFYSKSDDKIENIEIYKEKKQYTSIIRNTIRNDVLFFIALNSLNKDFTEYKGLLDKFDFFEHLNCRVIGDKIKFNLTCYSKSLSDINNRYSLCDELLLESLNYFIYPSLARRNDIKRFKIELPYSFVIEIMRNYAAWQYEIFISEINEKINPLPFVQSVNNRFRRLFLNESYSFYSFMIEGEKVNSSGECWTGDFYLKSRKSKKVSDFLIEIVNDNLSANEFKSRYNDLYFSGVKFKEGEWGRFINCFRLYELCIDEWRYNEFYKSVCNGELMGIIINIMVNDLKSTDLFKLGGVLVKENNGDVILFPN